MYVPSGPMIAYDVMMFKLASSMTPELLRNSDQTRVVSDAGETAVPGWLLARRKASLLSCATSGNKPGLMMLTSRKIPSRVIE